MPMVIKHYREFAGTVLGTTGSINGLITLSLDTDGYLTGDTIVVSGVVGTTGANGTFVVTRMGYKTIRLDGSTYNAAYVSGGTTLGGGTRTLMSNENAIDFRRGYPYNVSEDPKGTAKITIPSSGIKTFNPPIDSPTDPNQETYRAPTAINIIEGNNGLDVAGVGENEEVVYSRLKVFIAANGVAKVFIPRFRTIHFGDELPDGSIGVRGDLYFRRTTYSQYVREIDGTWTEIVTNTETAWATVTTAYNLNYIVGNASRLFISVQGTGTNRHVYESNDLGETWAEVASSSNGDEGIQYNSMVYIPSEELLLYGDGYFTLKIYRAGDVVPSTDSIQIQSGTDYQMAISLSLASNGTLFMSILFADGVDQYLAILFSTDDGYSWGDTGLTALSNSVTGRMFSLGDYTYVLTDADGIYSSNNTTISFAEINTGLPSESGTPVVTAVGLMTGKFTQVGLVWTWQNTGTSLFVAVTTGELSDVQSIYVSIDSGQTWTLASALSMTAPVVDIAVLDDTHVLFVGSGGGIQKSTDGGHTWADSDTGLPSFSIVNELAFMKNLYDAKLYTGLTWTTAEAPFFDVGLFRK